MSMDGQKVVTLHFAALYRHAPRRWWRLVVNPDERLLDVRCPHEHRFAQVVGSPSGPLVYTYGREAPPSRMVQLEADGASVEVEDPFGADRVRRVVVRLTELPADGVVEAGCRCCGTVELPVAWLREGAAAPGIRRVTLST